MVSAFFSILEIGCVVGLLFTFYMWFQNKFSK